MNKQGRTALVFGLTVLILIILVLLGYSVYALLSSPSTTGSLFAVNNYNVSQGGNSNNIIGTTGVRISSPGGDTGGNGNTNNTDTTAPGSVTGLNASSIGTDYITWSWTNPNDTDFDGAIIYLDGVSKLITLGSSYTANGLLPNTTHTIVINTRDDNGNINYNNVNDTKTTNSIGGNQAPVAEAGLNQTADENALVTLNGTGSSDADNDTITYSWTQVAGPNVTLSSSISATPAFTAPDVAILPVILTFSLIVNDGKVDSTADFVTITVNDVSNPGNHAPVAGNVSVTLDEDSSSVINFICTDADIGDTLTYSIVGNPSHGNLSGSGNSRTYTPDANYNGADSFTYNCNDGTVDSNIATVSLTINPVADNAVWTAPLANQNVSEDSINGTIVYPNITSLVTDADGDPVTITVASASTHYTLAVVGSNLVVNGLQTGNWYSPHGVGDTIVLSANGTVATFVFTVIQKLDECFVIGGKTFCD